MWRVVRGVDVRIFSSFYWVTRGRRVCGWVDPEYGRGGSVHPGGRAEGRMSGIQGSVWGNGSKMMWAQGGKCDCICRTPNSYHDAVSMHAEHGSHGAAPRLLCWVCWLLSRVTLGPRGSNGTVKWNVYAIALYAGDDWPVMISQEPTTLSSPSPSLSVSRCCSTAHTHPASTHTLI